MIQCKLFKYEEGEIEKLNEFVKTHEPKKDGIKFVESGIILFYELFQEFNEKNVLEALKVELNTHKQNCVDYEKQMRIAIEVRDSVSDKKSDAFKAMDSKRMADKRMLELEQCSVSVVEKMINELEEKKK